MKRTRLLAWGLLAAGAALAQPAPTVRTEEPRAFGWQVGDVITRHVSIDADEAFTLEPDSLPKTGRLGSAFELRRIQAETERIAGGRRHRLLLEYQVFFSPPAVRTLELPPLVLRFATRGRSQDVRVDAWPVTVAPLVPVDVSPRQGLGELQADLPPPRIDTAPTRWRLAAAALLVAGLLLFLLHRQVGLPWLARRQRPFASAWRRLRRLPPADTRAAFATLHEALNRSAGGALFEGGVDAFIAAQPRFAALREDLQQFFRRSRAAFFDTGAAPGGDTGPWLRQLCRRARDAERAGP